MVTWKARQTGIAGMGGKRYNGTTRFPSPMLCRKVKEGDNAKNMANELLVEGCGSEEVNGVYKKCEFYNPDREDGVSYFKTRSSDGLPCARLNRRAISWTEHEYDWEISILKGDHWLVHFDTQCVDLPMSRFWTRKACGVNPPPHIRVNPEANTEQNPSKRVRYD